MDWDLVAITATTAAAIAAIVSTLLRALDRPGPAWVFFDDNSLAWPVIEVELANVGDGVATEVRVIGLGCRVEMADTQVGWNRPAREVIPAVRPGETVHLRLACNPAGWDRAEVAVAYISGLGVLRRRRVVLRAVERVAGRPRMWIDEWGESAQEMRRIEAAGPHEWSEEQELRYPQQWPLRSGSRWVLIRRLRRSFA